MVVQSLRHCWPHRHTPLVDIISSAGQCQKNSPTILAIISPLQDKFRLLTVSKAAQPDCAAGEAFHQTTVVPGGSMRVRAAPEAVERCQKNPSRCPAAKNHEQSEKFATWADPRLSGSLPLCAHLKHVVPTHFRTRGGRRSRLYTGLQAGSKLRATLSCPPVQALNCIEGKGSGRLSARTVSTEPKIDG